MGLNRRVRVTAYRTHVLAEYYRAGRWVAGSSLRYGGSRHPTVIDMATAARGVRRTADKS